MEKRVIRTGEAPDAIGPYSQGIEAGPWVFTAGQIGLDPRTGELADTIEAQTARALENIRAILGAAGWPASVPAKSNKSKERSP